jgi:hypothetical protein
MKEPNDILKIRALWDAENSPPWWWRHYTPLKHPTSSNKTIWHYIPEGSNLHIRRCENMKSHNDVFSGNDGGKDNLWNIGF